jgi:hypothetical protein
MQSFLINLFLFINHSAQRKGVKKTGSLTSGVERNQFAKRLLYEKNNFKALESGNESALLT